MGLYDPCEKELSDLADSLKNQQREELTASAQVFGKNIILILMWPGHLTFESWPDLTFEFVTGKIWPDYITFSWHPGNFNFK